MKRIIVLVVMLIGLFGNCAYAKGPSIESTQEYIAEIMSNKEKAGDEKYHSKLEFTGTCEGVYTQLAYPTKGYQKKKFKKESAFFNLIDKHRFYYVTLSSKSELWLKGRDGLVNINIHYLDKTIEQDDTFLVRSPIHGIYADKIKKAVGHLNAECQKLSTKTKELF